MKKKLKNPSTTLLKKIKISLLLVQLVRTMFTSLLMQ